MALPIAVINQRGQAIWELIPAAGVIAALVSGVLFLAYLMFGRAWLTYQAEQALYCVTEGRTPAICKYKFEGTAKKALPWGSLELYTLVSSDTGALIRANWKVGGLSIPVQRKMDLSWSNSRRSSRYF